MTKAVLLLSLLLAGVGRAEDPVEQPCREFLRHLSPVHFVESGTQIDFTGEFTPIPAELTEELRRQFPEYTFRVANMTFLHWGPEPVRLLLVIDREHNSVRSYLWDVWFTEAPFSFGVVFGQQGKSEEIVKARMTALARLVCFQMDWTVGKVTIEKGVISVPLVNRDTKVWRIMRSRVTPHLPAESLAIVPPWDRFEI